MFSLMQAELASAQDRDGYFDQVPVAWGPACGVP